MNEEIKLLVAQIFIQAVKDHKNGLRTKKPWDAKDVYDWVCHSKWFNFYSQYMDSNSRTIRRGMLDKLKVHRVRYGYKDYN